MSAVGWAALLAPSSCAAMSGENGMIIAGVGSVREKLKMMKETTTAATIIMTNIIAAVFVIEIYELVYLLCQVFMT